MRFPNQASLYIWYSFGLTCLKSLQDSLFDEAKTELEELKKAVALYEQKTKPKSRIDVQTCTWTGVQEAIQVASLEEGSDDESNIAKKSCSKMARNIPDFETWLSLLPDGDYGAVVCGVFNMVVVVRNTHSSDGGSSLS